MGPWGSYPGNPRVRCVVIVPETAIALFGLFIKFLTKSIGGRNYPGYAYVIHGRRKVGVIGTVPVDCNRGLTKSYSAKPSPLLSSNTHKCLYCSCSGLLSSSAFSHLRCNYIQRCCDHKNHKPIQSLGRNNKHPVL